ncbi:hypothetical protein MRX96_045722 [Rhipicephalus microplus]
MSPFMVLCKTISPEYIDSLAELAAREAPLKGEEVDVTEADIRLCSTSMTTTAMKYALLMLLWVTVSLASQDATTCTKTTIEVGNGKCETSALSHRPGHVTHLSCPCANMICDDKRKRVIVTWC